MLVCGRCGTVTDDSSHFCPVCSYQLKYIQQPSADSTSQFTPPQPPYQQPTPQYPPNYQYPPQYRYPYTKPKSPEGTAPAILSIVFGCIALLNSLNSHYISLLIAVIGIILGFVGFSKLKSRGANTSSAIIGIGFSIIGVALAVFFIFLQ